MIAIQLKGRLGNQMFQYAAARTLAERLGCGLLVAGHTLGRRFGVRGHWLGLDERPPHTGAQQNGLLRNAFGLGSGFHCGRAIELAAPWLRRSWFPRSFSPRRVFVAGDAREAYDDQLHEQRSGTWLSGWFQSQKYFSSNANRVRQWFAPLPAAAKMIEAAAAQWPGPGEQMVGLHVRRGDYARIQDSISDSRNGWLLPIEYYHAALREVPAELPIAVFSDDPVWAASLIKDRPVWISQGNTPVVDLLLMARCRWNIIANSSFSWWSAWLNSHPDKVVIAPRYHLGFRVGEWVPDGIEVGDWRYLGIRNA